MTLNVPETSNARAVREFALVTAAFTALTLWLTWPAVLHIRSHFWCSEGDGLIFCWNLWWFRKALLVEHVSPFFTSYLHHPHGSTLLLHTMSPFNCVLALPLLSFFRMEVVYNLLTLFSFVASGVGMYYLARYLVKSRPAAFLAGIAFTFCPYHFAHALGHLNLVAMQWMPVYLLFLLKTIDEGRKRDGVLSGVFLSLTAYCSWYYLLFMLLMSVLVVVWRWRQVFVERRRLIPLALAGLVLLVAVGPILVAMIHAAKTRSFVNVHDPENFGADLTSFFVPSGVSAWAPLTLPVWSRWGRTAYSAETSNYLGIVLGAAALIAFIRVKQARFWVISAAVFFLLALGPHLHVLGRTLRVPLPYLVLHRYVPFFSLVGVPTRFQIMVVLCLSVAGSHCLACVFQEIRLSGALRWAVGLAVILLVLVDYRCMPLATTRFEAPGFYREMAADGEEYAVMEVPLGARMMYGATVHGKPLVFGVLARYEEKLWRWSCDTPVISSLLWGLPLPTSDDLPALARRVFRENGIRYLIVRGSMHVDVVEKDLKLTLVRQEEGVRVYDCR